MHAHCNAHDDQQDLISLWQRKRQNQYLELIQSRLRCPDGTQLNASSNRLTDHTFSTKLPAKVNPVTAPNECHLLLLTKTDR